MIRSFYELKILTSLCNEEVEKYDQHNIKDKNKIEINQRAEIKKRKAIELLFNQINEYRSHLNESRFEQRLYTEAFENLENHYAEKYRKYINFSVDLFVVRINALKAKYEKLKASPIGDFSNPDFCTVIEKSTTIESSATDLLEQMNIYICSSEKLQPLHIIDLYYTMSDYFHVANSFSSQYKHELAKRLKPELTEALQNFNFTLAKQLLSKLRELR